MKIPAIIAEIKGFLANDCMTVYREGRCLSVKDDPRYDDYTSLLTYVDRKLMDREERYTTLMVYWGRENYNDMDYAIYGDGDTRRQKWLRRWLLRELGIAEYSGSNKVVASDHLWMEAAND